MLKKILFLFSLALITSFNFQRDYELLNETDYQLALQDNISPAISIPNEDGTWLYSYNKWMCFPAEYLDINKSKVNYNGWKELPSINTNYSEKKTLVFELDHDEDWDTNSIVLKWIEELTNSQSVCIFGAFLESYDNEYIYFIEKIKFENSYWDRSEELDRINESEMED